MKWSPFSAYHEERDVGFNLEIKEELYISMIISSTVSLAVGSLKEGGWWL